GVAGKHTAPEDLARTPVPHTTYLLQREVPKKKISTLASKIKTRVRVRLEKIKRH
ncbi:MAG: hypothetical protein RL616_2302, partial [Verrucomicrobiota bacterium]